MELNAYTASQIQLWIALTQQAEAEGINSMPILRERLHDHLRQRLLAARVDQRRSMPLQLSCPRCGSPLELQPLCPQVSPHWRTACACTADDCAYQGLSAQPLDYLLRHGLDSVEER